MGTHSWGQLAGSRWPSQDLTCVPGTQEGVVWEWPLSRVLCLLLPVSVAYGLAQLQDLLGKGTGEAVGEWRDQDKAMQDWG